MRGHTQDPSYPRRERESRRTRAERDPPHPRRERSAAPAQNEIRHTRARRGYLAAVRTKPCARPPTPWLRRRLSAVGRLGQGEALRGVPCRTRRDTRGERGYDGRGAAVTGEGSVSSPLPNPDCLSRSLPRRGVAGGVDWGRGEDMDAVGVGEQRGAIGVEIVRVALPQGDQQRGELRAMTRSQIVSGLSGKRQPQQSMGRFVQDDGCGAPVGAQLNCVRGCVVCAGGLGAGRRGGYGGRLRRPNPRSRYR